MSPLGIASDHTTETSGNDTFGITSGTPGHCQNEIACKDAFLLAKFRSANRKNSQGMQKLQSAIRSN